jgi:hypothetical protein
MSMALQTEDRSLRTVPVNVDRSIVTHTVLPSRNAQWNGIAMLHRI